MPESASVLLESTAQSPADSPSAAASVDSPPAAAPAADLAALRRDGHLHIPGALSADDMAALGPGLRAFLSPDGLPNPFDRAQDGERGLSTLPPSVTQALVSPKLGRIAARLLETDAVRIWDCSSLYKAPGGAGVPWHQDLRFVPLDTSKMLTLWVVLADMTEEMSPLVYASGSHLEGPVDPADAIKRFPLTRQPPLKAGDVSIHHGWTLHSSLPHVGSAPREVVAIAYFADGARLTSAVRSPVVQRLNAYLRNAQPGELAAGARHPIAYAREAA